MSPNRLAAATLLGAVAASCAGAPREPLASFDLEQVAAPDATAAASVQLRASGNRAIVSWMERRPDTAVLRMAERTDAGWSEPRDVVSGRQLIVNSADAPLVVPLADGRLAAAWIEENGPNPEAYDLRLAWSQDAGRTWSAPVTPHDDGERAQHGFPATYELPGGGFGVIWLDGRNAVGGLIGDMALRTATYEANGTPRQQSVLDDRTCECCQTDAAMTSEGVVVVYRDRSPQEIRDIAVVRWESGRWSEPELVHDDGWKIAGCPVNGPAVSAEGREVAVAWFTVIDNIGHAFVAFSDDGGRSFGRPVSLDGAEAVGRVQVELIEPGVAAATWIELENGAPVLKLRRVSARGGRSEATTVGRVSGREYPRLARRGDELLIAWPERSDAGPVLRMARAVWRR
jgi:hypothetical protein